MAICRHSHEHCSVNMQPLSERSTGVKSIPQRVTGRDEEPLTVEKVKGGLKRTERKKRKSQVTEALPAISIYFIKTMLSC